MFKGPSYDTDFEEPFFLGVGADGYPRLVVTTKNNGSPNRQSTIVLSTGTGRVTHLADQLEHPLQADGDGDGNLDLFLIKPRKRSNLLESGQLISFNANGGRGRKMAGWFSMSDDVDGDGVRDLTSATPGDEHWQAFSGATGERLWKWAYSPANKNVFPLNKDVDGDTVNDFLVATCTQSRWDEPLLASLISGHEGRMLWQQEWAIDAGLVQSGVKCDDMNGDGVNDIVLVHQFSKGFLGSGNSGLRVSCFDGMSGDEHWHCDLAAVGSPAGNFRVGMIPIDLIDVDDNGSQDVFCRSFGLDGTSQLAAISGDSGEFLWKHALNEAVIFGASRFPSWRAAVLATGPNRKKQIVTAMAHEYVANAVSIVKVNFYDVANERPISTWSDVGNFKSPDWKNPPALGNGIPFEIVAGDKRYTGVCVQRQSAGKLQIVVLDSHQAEAKEVQRVDIPVPKHVPENFAAAVPFLIADTNQDGRTDVIFHDGTDLVTKDLINSKELNRKPLPTEYLNLLKVDLETSLLQIITRTAKDDRLKLVDLKTLGVVWDVHMPSGTYFNGLLSGGQPDEANLFATVPRALSTTDHCTIRTTATAAEYLGKTQRSEIRLGLPLSIQSNLPTIVSLTLA